MATDPNSSVSSSGIGSLLPLAPGRKTLGNDVLRKSVRHLLGRGVGPLAAIAAGSLIATGASAQSTAQDDVKASAKLEEIVVTAQKKVENLLEVPVPVTAISGVSLAT